MVERRRPAPVTYAATAGTFSRPPGGREVDVAGGPEAPPAPPEAAVTVSDSRPADVGALRVRRALPNRGRRTVGAWCFVDHAGPVTVDAAVRPGVGPHPHMGLHTVTWLLEGELVHRDSLGTEQVLRPGQLNLMTAGHGIAHAEESATGPGGVVHLVQLWVAQPAASRDGRPAFEHHDRLPEVALDHAEATVLVGRLGSAVSPARSDTDLVGIDLHVRPGRTAVPLEPAFEHAVVVTVGEVALEGAAATPGHLVYLGANRDELVVSAGGPARLLLLGGVPFPERLLMWWNLVARTREEIETGYRDWATGSERFGRVPSSLARIETGPPPWVGRGTWRAGPAPSSQPWGRGSP